MKLKPVLLLLLVVLSTTLVMAEDADLENCIENVMANYDGMTLESAQEQCINLGKYTKVETRKAQAQQNTETTTALRKQQRTVDRSAYEQAREAYVEAKERYVSYNRETRNAASIFSQAVQEQNECEEATGEECESSDVVPAAKNYLISSINTMIANIDTIVADVEANEFLTEEESEEFVRSFNFHRDALESFIGDANEAETKQEVVQVKVQVLRTWPKVKVLLVKYRNMLRQSSDSDDDDQGEDEDEDEEHEYECEDIVSCTTSADCGPVEEVEQCYKNGTVSIRRTPGQCIESSQCGSMCQFGRPVFIETICENGCNENGCIETEDDVPPAVGISIETVASGIGVNIVCQDEQSGCTDSFEYGIGDDCLGNQTNMTTMSYADNPIIIGESTTICIVAYDNEGNSVESTQIIDVTNQCFNGIEDANEEGVDCGGICDNQCNNCANGVQDWNEQGVDCGGACGLHCLTEEVDCNTFSFACSTDADCGGLSQAIECTDQGTALITYTSSYCASSSCGNVCTSGRGEIVEEFCEYGCSENVGCLEENQTTTTDDAYCIDSDAQNYNNQGTVTFLDHDAAGVASEVTVTDYCEDNATVAEHYCVGIDQARETHECEGACVNGACVNDNSAHVIQTTTQEFMAADANGDTVTTSAEYCNAQGQHCAYAQRTVNNVDISPETINLIADTPIGCFGGYSFESYAADEQTGYAIKCLEDENLAESFRSGLKLETPFPWNENDEQTQAFMAADENGDTVTTSAEYCNAQGQHCAYAQRIIRNVQVDGLVLQVPEHVIGCFGGYSFEDLAADTNRGYAIKCVEDEELAENIRTGGQYSIPSNWDYIAADTNGDSKTTGEEICAAFNTYCLFTQMHTYHVGSESGPVRFSGPFIGCNEGPTHAELEQNSASLIAKCVEDPELAASFNDGNVYLSPNPWT